MTDEVVKPRIGAPESFGWMRRPEYDTETGVCWEQPDGRLYLAQRGRPLTIAKVPADFLSKMYGTPGQ